MMDHKAYKDKENVNCFRRIKRFFRKKIGWNDLKMRYQLRVHLFGLFGLFFILYFIFMIAYTKIQYVHELVDIVSRELQPVIKDRLIYSTQAVSTTFYMVDKLGIDSSIRLSDVYYNTKNFDPFPIKADADGYKLFDASTLTGDQRVYNAGVACRNKKEPRDVDDLPTSAPLKQLKHMWE